VHEPPLHRGYLFTVKRSAVRLVTSRSAAKAEDAGIDKAT